MLPLAHLLVWQHCLFLLTGTLCTVRKACAVCFACLDRGNCREILLPDGHLGALF
jgi:hypothetical protein